MRRDPKAYLWDVRTASGRIVEFVADADLETFCGSALIRSAVERQFEIIGEALAQLARLDEGLAFRVPQCRRIIAFRNVLIHGYATLDSQLVWRVIQEDLSTLMSSVDRLLNESA